MNIENKIKITPEISNVVYNDVFLAKVSNGLIISQSGDIGVKGFKDSEKHHGIFWFTQTGVNRFESSVPETIFSLKDIKIKFNPLSVVKHLPTDQLVLSTGKSGEFQILLMNGESKHLIKLSLDSYSILAVDPYHYRNRLFFTDFQFVLDDKDETVIFDTTVGLVDLS